MKIHGFIFAPLIYLCLIQGSIASNSIARVWNLQNIAAIRLDNPNPPVHARNLFHVSVAMYDTWAAFDPKAIGYVYHQKFSSTNLVADRDEAISYAAYRILRERYSLSSSAPATLSALDGQMGALGYDKSDTNLDTSTPAGIGNSVAAAVSAYFIQDGALQTQDYIDYPRAEGGYAPMNPILDVIRGGPFATNANHWQPLYITNATAQNGFPAQTTQHFLGSQWLGVRPFALSRTDPSQPWFNPGPPPHLDGAGDAEYRSEVVDLLDRSSQMTPVNNATMDISPGAFGNNTLGANDGTGHPLNPVTGQPYASNVVKIGDFARVIAEFWADGPHSETPPGHWNVIANDTTDSPGLVKQIGGTGPVVDDLEWDVKLYFALNAALHDAAGAAWSLKRVYDGWRPVEAIRYMGSKGQSSDPSMASYNPDGLPLITNLIELVTTNTAAPGGRHAGLKAGTIAVFAWLGQPLNPTYAYSGVNWTPATNWWPYQRITFVTPSFPGYVSGHSAFSRAGAEVLAGITGSPFFPGGIGGYSNYTLAYEKGPSHPVPLQWGTYYDAADEAGISRLWGGIHVSVDDLTGRVLGSHCGKGAWALAQKFFDGSVLQTPVALTITNFTPTECKVRFNTVRGLIYKLQATPDLRQPFIDLPGESIQAVDSFMICTDAPATPSRFYRVAASTVP